MNLIKKLVIESLFEIKSEKSEDKVKKILEKLAKERGYDSFTDFYSNNTFSSSNDVIEIFKDYTRLLHNDNS